MIFVFSRAPHVRQTKSEPQAFLPRPRDAGELRICFGGIHLLDLQKVWCCFWDFSRGHSRRIVQCLTSWWFQPI